MSKILSYKNNRNSIVLSVSLIVSIIITNSFIVFSPDENSRSYFSNLTSTITVGIPMVIAFVMVFRYKRSIKKQEDKLQVYPEHDRVDLYFPGTVVCCSYYLDLPVSTIFEYCDTRCILVYRVWIFWLFPV